MSGQQSFYTTEQHGKVSNNDFSVLFRGIAIKLEKAHKEGQPK